MICELVAPVVCSGCAVSSDQEKWIEEHLGEWIEERDVESVSYEKATWIPLAIERTELLRGRSGHSGYRREYCDVACLIVPLDLRPEFDQVDWQSVNRTSGHSAWATETVFIPPGCYGEDPRVRYPVIEQTFETDQKSEWSLLQELEVALNLVRREDSWIRPDENEVEVAKLDRDDMGKPIALMLRAEHLRDYLCAKKAALLLTRFTTRQAVEKNFPTVTWASNGRVQRHFTSGEWEGACIDIHEGGELYGRKTNVLHMWRESVNPQDDVPVMPEPWEEKAAKSNTYSVEATGCKLRLLQGGMTED